MSERWKRRFRSKVWFWLICLADRISPEDAFRLTPIKYRFVLGKGIVTTTKDNEPGCPLWAQDSFRDLAYDQGDYFRD